MPGGQPEVTPDTPTANEPQVLSDAAILPAAYRDIHILIKDVHETIECRILPVEGDQFPRDDWSRPKRRSWLDSVTKVRSDCPNIDAGKWGLLQRVEDNLLAAGTLPGNCWGLTFGGLDNTSPSGVLLASDRYIAAKGATDPEAVAAAQAEYDELKKSKDGWPELARNSLQQEIGSAVAIAKHGEQARYAWFDEHIALYLGAPLNHWLSRNTNRAQIYVHETLEQLAGSAHGDLIATFTAVAPEHIEVR